MYMPMFILLRNLVSQSRALGERQQLAKVEVLHYWQLAQNFGFVHLDHALIDFRPRLDLCKTSIRDL